MDFVHAHGQAFTVGIGVAVMLFIYALEAVGFGQYPDVME